jgi:hypothetical protein
MCVCLVCEVPSLQVLTAIKSPLIPYHLSWGKELWWSWLGVTHFVYIFKQIPTIFPLYIFATSLSRPSLKLRDYCHCTAKRGSHSPCECCSTFFNLKHIIHETVQAVRYGSQKRLEKDFLTRTYLLILGIFSYSKVKSGWPIIGYYPHSNAMLSWF